MRIGVIGGGASGVLFSLKYKQLHPESEIIIYEKNPRPLKKILATGNGRCNLGNTEIEPVCFNDPTFISSFLAVQDREEINQFFRDLGLYFRVEEGRIYPYSNQATTVVELLERQLYFKKITVKSNIIIEQIQKIGNQYQIDGDLLDIVVIAIGSPAGVSNDEKLHYQLLNKLQIPYTKLAPALVGLKTKERFPKLKGQRAQVHISYGNITSDGEMIFREDGVSGICFMNLAREYHRMQEKQVKIDFLPDFAYDTLLSEVKLRLQKDSKLRLHQWLGGALPAKLLQEVHSQVENKLVKEMSVEEQIQYLSRWKAFPLTIIGTYDWKEAQVVTGGIPPNLAFQPLKHEEIYSIGEVVDIDGICGGYNLWFAFTSGLYLARKLYEHFN